MPDFCKGFSMQGMLGCNKCLVRSSLERTWCGGTPGIEFDVMCKACGAVYRTAEYGSEGLRELYRLHPIESRSTFYSIEDARIFYGLDSKREVAIDNTEQRCPFCLGVPGDCGCDWCYCPEMTDLEAITKSLEHWRSSLKLLAKGTRHIPRYKDDCALCMKNSKCITCAFVEFYGTSCKLYWGRTNHIIEQKERILAAANLIAQLFTMQQEYERREEP